MSRYTLQHTAPESLLMDGDRPIARVAWNSARPSGFVNAIEVPRGERSPAWLAPLVSRPAWEIREAYLRVDAWATVLDPGPGVPDPADGARTAPEAPYPPTLSPRMAALLRRVYVDGWQDGYASRANAEGEGQAVRDADAYLASLGYDGPDASGGDGGLRPTDTPPEPLALAFVAAHRGAPPVRPLPGPLQTGLSRDGEG